MKMHFLIIFMFFMGLFSFVMNTKHMLMMLLSYSIYYFIFIIFNVYMFFKFKKWVFFFNTFLSFSVCESFLGLSLLVSLIRFHGSNYFNLLNLLW